MSRITQIHQKAVGVFFLLLVAFGAALIQASHLASPNDSVSPSTPLTKYLHFVTELWLTSITISILGVNLS